MPEEIVAEAIADAAPDPAAQPPAQTAETPPDSDSAPESDA
jgi:hypothetical protein